MYGSGGSEMCNFWSCIIDRHLKVHYDGNDSSHEAIIKKAGLKDTKLIDRDFVRIEKELSPQEELVGLLRELEDSLVKTRALCYRAEMILRVCEKCKANNKEAKV
jgi:hypothetical protein